MRTGVNFYGLKKKLWEDFDGTIRRLKETGFTSAELCVIFDDDRPQLPGVPEAAARVFHAGIWHYKEAPEKIRKLREAGLQVVSLQIMGNPNHPLDDLVPRMVSFGKENGISHFCISFNKNLEEMKAMADVTKKVSEAFAREGLTFAYHNHDPECPFTDGVNALDYILDACPALMLELDVGWVAFSGEDPVEFMKRYKDRIALLHLKDICEGACPENRAVCFRAIGEGILPLPEIMREAKTGCIVEEGIIIDQDDSTGDILVDLDRGLKNISVF